MSGRVHVEERNGLGILILDRPEALNALSHRMVQTVSAAIARWHGDPAIRAILIKAVPGRAFCAGGDIRLVIETTRRKGVAAAAKIPLNLSMRSSGSDVVSSMGDAAAFAKRETSRGRHVPLDPALRNA